MGKKLLGLVLASSLAGCVSYKSQIQRDLISELSLNGEELIEVLEDNEIEIYKFLKAVRRISKDRKLEDIIVKETLCLDYVSSLIQEPDNEHGELYLINFIGNGKNFFVFSSNKGRLEEARKYLERAKRWRRNIKVSSIPVQDFSYYGFVPKNPHCGLEIEIGGKRISMASIDKTIEDIEDYHLDKKKEYLKKGFGWIKKLK